MKTTSITPCLGALGLAAVLAIGYPNFAAASTSRISGPMSTLTALRLAKLQDTGGGKSPTASGIRHKEHPSGPIVVNWKIKEGKKKPKVIDGVKYEPVGEGANVNLTVNPDGSWNFSGSFPSKPDHDLDVVVGLKSKQGSIVLFRYSGGMANGAQWDKTGVNETLKDNFQSFRSTDWYGNYRTPESSEGVAKQYKERKDRKEKEEKQHQKHEAEKEKQEIATEVARRKNHQSPPSGGGGGGGSNILGDVTGALSGGLSDVTNAVGGAVSSVASGIGDVASSILSIF